jgi:hypothetical protein
VARAGPHAQNGEVTMSSDTPSAPRNPPVSAEQLRMMMLEKEMEAMATRRKAQEAEEKQRAEAARDFLEGHVTEEEAALIRRIVMTAVADGKLEALVYTFPASLCADNGRAINNSDPTWPTTLQGKARELYDRYKQVAQPQGYRLKAMIVSWPNGMPGDVGLYLNWASPEV